MRIFFLSLSLSFSCLSLGNTEILALFCCQSFISRRLHFPLVSFPLRRELQGLGPSLLLLEFFEETRGSDAWCFSGTSFQAGSFMGQDSSFLSMAVGGKKEKDKVGRCVCCFFFYIRQMEDEGMRGRRGCRVRKGMDLGGCGDDDETGRAV